MLPRLDARTRLRLGVGLTVLVVAAAATVSSPAAVVSRLAWVAADPVRFGVVLLAGALVRPLVAWPTTLLAVAAGYGYGVVAMPFALALVVVTSVPPYVLARRLRGDGDGRVARTGTRVVDAAGAVRSVTASRLLPAPSDVVSAGAGVAGIPLSAFVVGTALGEVPWVVAGVLAGSSAESLATGAVADVIDLRLVVAAALVAVGLLARPAYRYATDGRGETRP